jgi:hypothetical protein
MISDAMIAWIEEQQWEEYERTMNEEPVNELSTIACNPTENLPY